MSVFLLTLMTTAGDAGCARHHRGDLVVERQADVTACLETVDGDLVLGTGSETIRLPALTDVTGVLDLTLAGRGRADFPALERVHQGFELELRGGGTATLPRLEHVGGPLGLDLDPAGSRVALPRLRRHGAGVWLFGGGKLDAVLPALERVAGTVFIQPTGPTEGALPALRAIGGHLVLSNGGHIEFAGLGALETVDGGLYVFGGRGLSLPALGRVGGALAIRDSRARDLARLGRPGAEIGALLLRDNRKLEDWPSHLSVPANRVRVDGSPALRR